VRSLSLSVATTSSKPPAVLKADIRRVLDRMQVQYRETKTGFDCIHLPSIDISSLQDPHGTTTMAGTTPRRHRKQGSGGSGDSGGTTRRIVRKASKLSFGVGRKDKDKEKDRDRIETSVNGSTHKEKERERDAPGRASDGASAGPATLNAGQSSGSSSFFNVSSSNAPTTTTATTAQAADDHSHLATLHPEDSPRRSNSPARSKNLPPIPRDFGATTTPATPQGQGFPTGEVDREVLESVGQNTLSVRFEINIVKVSFPPFHWTSSF
jgi:serine/threonine protein kinase KIN1/2